MMNKLYELIKKNGQYTISTVDTSGNPAARIFSSAILVDGELCICTGAGKKVDNDIVGNNHIVLSGYLGEMSWWRASAVARDVTSAKHVEAMFEDMPPLKNLYKEGNAGGTFTMKVYALDDAKGEQFLGMSVEEF